MVRHCGFIRHHPILDIYLPHGDCDVNYAGPPPTLKGVLVVHIFNPLAIPYQELFQDIPSLII